MNNRHRRVERLKEQELDKAKKSEKYWHGISLAEAAEQVSIAGKAMAEGIGVCLRETLNGK